MFKIWFHGTNKRNAERILKTGFKVGTFFAEHLEDAIGYGGLHVFEVAIDFKKTPLGWQAICSNHIGHEGIVSYKLYKKKIIKQNQYLRNKVFEANK